MRLGYILPFMFLALLFIAYALTPASDLIDLNTILNAPSLNHIFGTDELGRDIFARLLEGVMLSITVGILVCLISASLGIMVGTLSAYLGGWWDAILMRITDVFLSFPGVLIAIGIAALAGPSVWNIIFALGFLGWVSFARLSRASTLSLLKREYMQAAKLNGVSHVAILTRYILPNISAPLIIECIFTISGAMLAEAGLSFLGIGVQAPQASLGIMLREGARYMLVAPHMVFFSGFSLMLLVLMMNLLGEHLRNKLDVRKSNEC